MWRICKKESAKPSLISIVFVFLLSGNFIMFAFFPRLREPPWFLKTWKNSFLITVILQKKETQFLSRNFKSGSSLWRYFSSLRQFFDIRKTLNLTKTQLSYRKEKMKFFQYILWMLYSRKIFVVKIANQTTFFFNVHSLKVFYSLYCVVHNILDSILYSVKVLVKTSIGQLSTEFFLLTIFKIH